MIARTLYTSLGPEGWRLYVYGNNARRLIAKAQLESRIPLQIFKDKVIVSKRDVASRVSRQQTLLVVDRAGAPITELMNRLPRDEDIGIIVDYTGNVIDKEVKAYRVTGLGTEYLAYEASIVVYFLARYHRRTQPPLEKDIFPEPLLALNVARRVREALVELDGYYVLEPNTFSYSLAKLLKRRMRVIIEPTETSIVIDHTVGKPKQRIRLTVYSLSKLKRIKEALVELEGEVLKIEGIFRETLKLYIDLSCGKICLDPGGRECISLGKAEEEVKLSNILLWE